MYQTIVVGADGSNRSCTAVEHAARLASSVGAALHVVSALRAPVSAGMDERPAPSRQFKTAELSLAYRHDHAEGLVARLRQRGIAATAHVHFGDAAQVLCDVAAEVDADLIVVGNKGFSGIRRFINSVPADVARTSIVPVLIVHTG